MSTSSPASGSQSSDDADDGAADLDFRAVFRLLLEHPAVRNYTIAALAALAMVVLVLFEQGSDVGGLLVAIVGVSGVLLRWPAAPALVLFFLVYFLYSPMGLPGDGYYDSQMIWHRRFYFVDVFLVLSVLVYFIAQYRLFALALSAVVRENTVRRESDAPIRRPKSLIRPTEVGGMLSLAVILVVVGQIVWLFATGLELADRKPIPLRSVVLSWGAEHQFPLWVSRGTILVGLLFFVVMIARFAIGYWRMKTMSREEAQMYLLDQAWSETSRERMRLETWRAWAKRRRSRRLKAGKTHGDLR